MSSRSAVIRVEGLSKSFEVGAARGRNDTFFAQMMSGVRGLVRRGSRPKAETHWALRDVSFEVEEGDIVALIGHNGAGKSTLLKVLSRITDPTAGFAELRGRVGSLLEVGTGFHPELTGRENVYLSGAILGLRRAEIARDFDEIVEFAEVEKYIDTPVKRYSSGMTVRLAFAVATQLKPEILLIDEVLAVGDARFQRKCLARIQEVGRSSRTIIFVSHSMAAIRAICRTGIVLEGGRIVARGDVGEVVDAYLASASAMETAVGAVETKSVRVEEVRFVPGGGPLIKTFEPLEVRIRFRAKTALSHPGIVLKLSTSNHERLAGLDFWNFGALDPMQPGDEKEVAFQIESLPLLPGTYIAELEMLTAHTRASAEQVPHLFQFEVAETPLFGTRRMDGASKHGNVAMKVSVIGARSD